MEWMDGMDGWMDGETEERTENELGQGAHRSSEVFLVTSSHKMSWYTTMSIRHCLAIFICWLRHSARLRICVLGSREDATGLMVITAGSISVDLPLDAKVS
jgi:hypothetical protein